LTPAQRFYVIHKELHRRVKTRKIWQYYPDEGPLRRELYVPHQAFFAAGAEYRERCIIAANRIGKSEGVGGYETALHLTGKYPDWWAGRRFDGPISAWACGDTGTTVRDINQAILLGPPGDIGTGLIPGDMIIGAPRKKAGGVPDAIESVSIKHTSGGVSRLTFKSYAEGRQSFQGTAQHLIWLDEECPEPVYGECVIRTMTTKGMILLTFTPLMGLTDVVLRFMKDGVLPEGGIHKGRFVVNATWDDAPHLDDQAKQEILDTTQPYLRDARSKGKPHLGAGAIYPVDEDLIKVDPFDIPDWWPRVYALDVGWNKTAALWCAVDRESETGYLYSEHYLGEAQPPIHAAAIHARGKWIPGVIDPAARGRSQRDGLKLMDDYLGYGLNLSLTDNALEAGIYKVWTMLSTGRLKVFSTLVNWFMEFRLYRRDEKGKVIAERDHLMDNTRYLVLSGLDLAEQRPVDDDDYEDYERERMTHHAGRSEVGGY